MGDVGKQDVSSGYYIAAYICVSLLLMMLVTLLFYVICSRRFRLNWYERTQLTLVEGSSSPCTSPGTTVGTPDVLSDVTPFSGRTTRSISAGQLDTSPTDQEREFWVPVELQRQYSMGQELHSYMNKGDDSPATPNTPMGIKVSPFALTQAGMTTEKGYPVTKYVQPVVAGSPAKRSRLSMYSKLDHTKIDTSMYSEQMDSLNNGSLSEDVKSSVQFSIFYNAQFSLFCIQLLQATNLVARDFSGTADPYAKVRLLPDKTDTRQSSIHRKTLNPQFEEEFVYEISLIELAERTLEIMIFDYDEYSRHQCMGSVQFPLQNINFSEKKIISKDLSQCENSDEESDVGELMFSLGYLPSAERLTVVVLKARNLRSTEDPQKLIDPYVKVYLSHAEKRIKKKKKTTTHKSSLNPVFNEALTFSVSKDALKTIILQLTVMNSNTSSQKEVIGHVVIGPDSKGNEAIHMQEMLASKSAVAMWHRLTFDDGV